MTPIWHLQNKYKNENQFELSAHPKELTPQNSVSLSLGQKALNQMLCAPGKQTTTTTKIDKNIPYKNKQSYKDVKYDKSWKIYYEDQDEIFWPYIP